MAKKKVTRKAARPARASRKKGQIGQLLEKHPNLAILLPLFLLSLILYVFAKGM